MHSARRTRVSATNVISIQSRSHFPNGGGGGRRVNRPFETNLSSSPLTSPLARVRAISSCPPLFRTRHHRYKTIVRYDEEASISPDNLPDRNSRTIMANNRCSVSPDYIFQENIYSSPIENRTRARHASGIKQTCVQHAFRRPFENPKIPNEFPFHRWSRGEIRELSRVSFREQRFRLTHGRLHCCTETSSF